MAEIEYRLNTPVSSSALDQLYLVSWPNHQPPYDFGPELAHALAYACAYAGDELIGFVRLAWDGGVHAFLLEPTVRPDYRRRGIGRALVERALSHIRAHGISIVHVDYLPDKRGFYEACGFRTGLGGILEFGADTAG